MTTINRKQFIDEFSKTDLDYYYVVLAELVRHPNISAERKAEVEALRKEVLKLRYPDM